MVTRNACLWLHLGYLQAMPHCTRSIAFATVVALGGIASVASADCGADVNGDSIVDAIDLGALLANWGNAGNGDIDGDGTVGGNDVTVLLASWMESCASEPTEIRMAAIQLAAHPYASFVQAFIVGTPVSAAIDPALTPVTAGASADLYVVAARSQAGWSANRTLTDARGAAQVLTFAAGGIAANRFTLTGMNNIPADTSLSVGIGFDLVLDMDRDGTLSGGDLIDGGGDRSAIWWCRDPGATGPLAVTTLSAYTASGATAGYTSSRLWYPTSIATLGVRPLIVISHGNGHQYIWYDYLGTHLASWGFIVISHQNNTAPGIETASTTTLQHTSAIIAQQGTVAAGAINGHLDATRIGWVGHSRGGEGIARAYDRLYDGTYVATGYNGQSLKFLCSIAPTDFLGPTSAHPHAANYMVLWGAADGDVSGIPTNTVAWSFDLSERSTGYHNTVYVHGADHNDFNCCGINDFVGPAGTAIGNAGAQAVAKAFILAGMKYHLDGETALEEFLWRPSSTLRPPVVASTTTLVKELCEQIATGSVVIDNFQTQTGTTTSSSGGTVTSTVANISEALARDTDASYTWSTANPHNGSIRAQSTDAQRMVAWDWNSAQSMEWSVPVALQDVSGRDFVELRVGQGTRHPNTVTLNGDATCSIVLRDATGVEARVSSSAQGEGIKRVYQRTGSGTGTGWQNELRTIRLRLRDFQTGGTGIDLARIAAVRLEVGGTAGSTTGRFVIDDLQFTKE